MGSSGHHMMTDLNAELLFTIAHRSSLGLGIGYIFAGDPMIMHHHKDGPMNDDSNDGHSFSILPVSLTIHYRLPVNEKFSISLKGGGGFYTGWFSDVTPELSYAFGPHAGIVFDYKIAHGIFLLTEGYYRSVLFDEYGENNEPSSSQFNVNLKGFVFGIGIRFDI